MAKVIRILLYEGNQGWIDSTFKSNAVIPDDPFALPGYGKITDLGSIRLENDLSPENAALEGSIRKWEDIVEGYTSDARSVNCPLCQTRSGCKGCIVAEYTGKIGCLGTPYEVWAKHHRVAHKMSSVLSVQCDTCRSLALDMVNFLKKLRGR